MPQNAGWCLSLVVLLVLVILARQPTPALACGMDTDCEIGTRTYRIMLPAQTGETELIGAIIFVHGYRGTAAQVMGNKDLTALASHLGVAFVAAEAAGPEWNIPNVPSVDSAGNADELAYFDDLVSDVTQRFAVDPSKIVVAGFSSGAMMVWHLACYRGTSFAGFVPMSGTFWAPIPDACPTGAVNLIHYHGREDPVVPLHGRPIKDAQQGDIFDAVALIVRTGEYRPLADAQPPGIDCSRWADPSGHLLELCLFDGKHMFRAQNLSRAAQLFLAD